jgi:hypothetical protein
MPHRARVWSAEILPPRPALFARNIDRHLAQHDLRTRRAGHVEGVTLSDGEAQEERTPIRRYAQFA